ncbi:pyridoxamine 5'-phosphate oxidase family protein [Streptomyces griseocarneus]|uniref:pyridoxamine 5'-phosphate oxidase family protein n=1 Tax=Streptomyces griseocarneus TaxID=51201 RepID=UPI00167C524C|nr:pyridoxamine 5'-phosphate oxidase family protein [Streptomyces griseocarneus]MBZ6472937.1 pyridoxamine 5'-phosphate oxidase family protein [Streptomyces griseocarneus]
MLAAPSRPSDDYRALELLARTPYGRVSVSMRALPFVTVARHVVVDGQVLLRLHGGFGYAQACDGSVVAYGADNLAGREEGDESVWTVQFVGTARIFAPGPAELELFGRAPHSADDAPFIPEYLCIEPQFISLHHLEGVPARRAEHSA